MSRPSPRTKRTRLVLRQRAPADWAAQSPRPAPPAACAAARAGGVLWRDGHARAAGGVSRGPAGGDARGPRAVRKWSVDFRNLERGGAANRTRGVGGGRRELAPPAARRLRTAQAARPHARAGGWAADATRVAAGCGAGDGRVPAADGAGVVGRGSARPRAAHRVGRAFHDPLGAAASCRGGARQPAQAPPPPPPPVLTGHVSSFPPY